jgi:large conductance mechanosensitive channel
VLRGFRDFILRGNVVDLAVAVVIGAAFTRIIAAFVEDLLTPLIAAIVGKPDFSALTFKVNGSQFRYGDFVNALIAFMLVAAVIYFLVVVPVSRLYARPSRGEEPPPEPTEDILLLRQIRDLLSEGRTRT